MTPVSRRSLLTLGLAAGATALTVVDGAVAGASRRQPGRNPILGKGGVHHVAVRTRDWDKTLQFYQQVLGFRVALAWQERVGDMSERLSGTRPNTQRWAYLDSGDGTCIEVFEDPDFVPPSAGSTDPTSNPGNAIVHFGLRTSRVDAVCEHARRLGATLLGDPLDFTLETTTGQGAIVVRIGFLQGPSGEWIELIQNTPQ